MFTIELEGIDELEREWDTGIKTLAADGMRSATVLAATAGAETARSEHKYKNHTGDLTASVQVEPSRVTRDGVESAFFTDSPYAGYVNDGTKPHEIRPKAARGFVGPLPTGQSRKRRGKGSRVATPTLAWMGGDGAWHHAKVVHHPGTKPDPFMNRGEIAALFVLEQELDAAIDRFVTHMNG